MYICMLLEVVKANMELVESTKLQDLGQGQVYCSLADEDS